MSQTWYCRVDGQVYGPFTREQLRAMADEGRVVAATAVRQGSDASWTSANQIEGLLRLPTPPPPPPSSAGPAAKPAFSGGEALGADSGPAASGPAAAPAASAGRNGSTTANASRGESSGSAVRPRRARWLEEEGKPATPPPVTNGPLPVPLAEGAAGPAPAASEVKRSAGKRSSSRVTRLAGFVAAAVLGITLSVALFMWLALAWARSVIRKEVAAAMAEYQAALAQIERNPDTPAPPAAAKAPAAAAKAASTGAAVPGNSRSAAPAAPGAASGGAAWRAEAEKVVSSVAAWHDVTQIRGIDLLDLKLQIRRAWLATDERGTRREMVNDAAADPPPPPAARYVFIEISLRNTGTEPRTYTSWNELAGTSAVLADAGGTLLEFVPPSETPDVSRRGAVQLGPGDALADLLVFRAPEGEISTLRLALAKRAIAGKARVAGGTHFGFQIPSSLLADDTGNSSTAP